MERVKIDLINGNVKQVDNSNLTVAEWIDIWFAAHENDLEITTHLQREQAIRLNIAVIAVVEDDKKNANFLNPAELKQFLVFAKDHECITTNSIILTLAYTGMRRGEAIGLRWDYIDFDKKTISIKRTRDEYGARKPKTKNSNRRTL
ncbi:tyrosine-type recombinase/integrase [Sporosarcina sp. NPDC096371]|uniref:tyrosine-type recombinase/integrase n=1 Tax=Sporosarcina sp. NPDC096371 TaxID=3364530 RepID=UPI003823B292